LIAKKLLQYDKALLVLVKELASTKSVTGDTLAKVERLWYGAGPEIATGYSQTEINKYFPLGSDQNRANPLLTDLIKIFFPSNR
jgi:hypothetical protein